MTGTPSGVCVATCRHVKMGGGVNVSNEPFAGYKDGGGVNIL